MTIFEQKKKLRACYSLLNDCKKIDPDKEIIKLIKKQIRELHKSINEPVPPEHDWKERYKDSYDTAYVKYKLPYHLTEEEKMEFIDNNWCECPYSPYDCTGYWFTSRILLIDCGNETIVIHVKNQDV